jgi:cobalt-zinc-cadmium efflux system outer membrane protein
MGFLLFLAVAATTPDTLDLSLLPDEAALADFVWRHAPALQAARARVAAARAEVDRAHLLPNPSLDVSVNTLPVGPLNALNPPELQQHPFTDVPNLAVGLSVLLEVGKRTPRQDAMREAARATALEMLEEVRQRTLSLVDVAGDIAAAEVRVATLEHLGEDSARLTQLQRARADKGDTSLLDADRAQLEQEGTWTALADAREAVAEGLRLCSGQLGVPCLPFASPEKAARFLARRFETTADFSGRPDLRALKAVEASARANRTLAARRLLPDPTLRLGYVHDRFIASGNQQNSLFVGLSFSLPFFDRGQLDVRAAEVAASAALTTRERLVTSALSQLDRIEAQLATVEARRIRLREQSLPLAERVVARLETAVNRGAAPLQELLLARRTRAEILLAQNDLDRAAFHLQVERARLTGGGVALPAEVTDAP